MTESMIILNAKDEVVFFNAVATRLQSIFKTPMRIGAAFLDLVSPARREIVRYILNQVKATRKFQTTEAEYKDSNGHTYFYEVTYSPVATPDSDELQICVVGREITHQKIFEKRATQLLNEFSDMMMNANAVIFAIDSRGYITEWNNECARITGLNKNDVFAQRISQFVTGSKAELEMLLADVLAGRVISNYELHIGARGGNAVTVLTNPTAKRSQDGHAVGILFVGQDVTELMRYRASLEQEVRDRTDALRQSLQKEKELVELKNRFVSIASHEFRVPLSMIRASCNYIRTNPFLRNEDSEKLDQIERQLRHMNAMLEDVLTLERGVTKLNVNHQKIDLIAELKNIIAEVDLSFGDAHRAKLNTSAQALEMYSDVKLFRNIFVNLLSNALKFSPDEAEVSVYVSQQPKLVEIQVTDHGIGINESEMDRISEPFYRGSNAACISGTGLGLSIVKKAVETLGGTIKIDSKLEQGTTVTVRFNPSGPILNGIVRPFE